MLIDSLHLV